jgi:SnoaL-like domain
MPNLYVQRKLELSTRKPKKAAQAEETKQMSGILELELWYELFRLETRYWREVDCNAGRHAHEFYRSEGVFRMGRNCFAGRDCIKLYYQWRESHCHAMTTRHFVNNLIVESTGEDFTRVVGLVTCHRMDRVRMASKGTVPVLIADLVSDCVRGDDGVWRYASHALAPVFASDVAPLSLSITPEFLTAAQRRRDREIAN